MRLAIDTNCILPGRVGGIENYTLALIEALKRPDSPIESMVLVARPENRDLFSRFVDRRVEIALIDRPLHEGHPVNNWAALLANDPVGGPRTLASFQQQKAALLHRLDVDLVHFPGNSVNPLDLDLPVVLNLHDLQHRHFPHYFTAGEIANRETWWKASAERADALIAASNYVRDDLCAQWQINPERIFVTPDPFESSFFSPPNEGQLAEARTRLALPELFFLYPAAVWPHKNHERLLRAFAFADIAGAQLILTGGGQLESNLPGLIESLNLSSRVRLLGRVNTSDLCALYHLATAMIFPSQHESWSIPVMEAMACGCPVASSDVTSLPEEVGDAGLLFDPDDIAAVASAMHRLADNQELRQTLAARGRHRVREFSPEQFLRTVTEAYEHAVQSRRAKVAA